MAKLMIYDTNDVSLENDLAVSYKKGYVVEVFEDTDTKCSTSSPFVSLVISDKTAAEMREKYLTPWTMIIDFNIISYDVNLDKWRLAMYVTNPGVSNAGAATAETVSKATSFMTKWGGTNIAVVGNTLEFDVSCYSAITSGKFWNCEPSLITFSEVDYDSVSGIHIITADYSDLLTYQLGPTYDYSAAISNALASKMTVLKKVGNVVTFYVHRDDVVTHFMNDIKGLSSDVVCLRRYCFTSAGVDAIISNGRTFTAATEESISAYIIDKTLEA